MSYSGKSLKCSQYAKHIAINPNIVYNYYMPVDGSVTFGYAQKKENLQSSLELKSRVNQLYSEVGFAFKQSYPYEAVLLYHSYAGS